MCVAGAVGAQPRSPGPVRPLHPSQVASHSPDLPFPLGSLWGPEHSRPPEGLSPGDSQEGWVGASRQISGLRHSLSGPRGPRCQGPWLPPVGPAQMRALPRLPTLSSWFSWGHRPEKRLHSRRRLGICFGRTPALVCLAPSPKERWGPVADPDWPLFPVPASVARLW